VFHEATTSRTSAAALYLIPASLGDAPTEWTLPPRVKELVAQLDYFIVERAKTARAELKRLGHPKPVRTLVIRELSERPTESDLDGLLAPLRSGQSAGLMSEAGCPGIADPGSLIVRRAHEAGLRVAPLIGPSSILLALMASGLNGQRFTFHGYLPVGREDLRRRILALEQHSRESDCTQIFIETPYRNEALFKALVATVGSATLLCVATNLTLASERIDTRTAAQWRRSGSPSIAGQPTVFLLLASR